ncbi:MAG: hypothetical protein ACYTGC_11355 [Planctomycetota bacterium]|jgi:hypothetical protein
MSEIYEHNPEDHEDPIPAATWLIGFIGAVLLVIIVLGLTSLFYGADAEELERKVLAQTPIDRDRLEQTQLAWLEGPPRRVVTQQDGEIVDDQIVIPIEDAMARVVAEMGGDR